MRRTSYPARIADLAFSIEIPEGFEAASLPDQKPNFDNPTESAPLLLLASPVGFAVIMVAARPAYQTGSVLQWVRYLANHFDLTLLSERPGEVGTPERRHTAILATASQVQNGTPLSFFMVAFEDGGRFVTAHGMCPTELWPSYGERLTEAVTSIALDRPHGPTHDLDSTDAPGWVRDDGSYARSLEAHTEAMRVKREPAVAAARGLIAEGRFDDAERLVIEADPSIQGAVAIKSLYEMRLREMAASPDSDRSATEVVFHRALAWALNCYPEPHTEVEAEQYESGRVRDRARLTEILGYTPEAA
ncbi:MAG: hypothetical protein HRU70_05100 [Phycisphaeraceae bacterium]|nr:MAG: hypothetical protein HRU70_05100 [Phycisphaeraceae bacterium]